MADEVLRDRPALPVAGGSGRARHRELLARAGAGDVAVAEVEINRRDERNLEHPAIRFLRSYSNYLTPRIGLSKDALVAVATYLRNLLLNQCILIALMAGLLILPRIAALAAKFLVASNGFAAWFDWIMIIVLMMPTFAIALGLFYRQTDKNLRRPWFMRRLALIALVDAPIVLGAFLAACFHVQPAARDDKSRFWSVLVVYVVLWFIGVILAKLYSPETRKSLARIEMSREKAKWQAAFIAFAVLAGAAGGGAGLGLGKAIPAVPGRHPFLGAGSFRARARPAVARSSRCPQRCLPNRSRDTQDARVHRAKWAWRSASPHTPRFHT